MPDWVPDTYTLSARLLPAYIVVWPLGLALAVWFPGEDLGALASALLAPALLAPLAAQFGRDAGRRAQERLWKSWGGAPTTQLLRHRSKGVNSVLRQRYHRKLKELDPTLHLPTADAEAQDPDAADRCYEAAVQVLINRTRGDKLVFKENVNYGVRRNLWGMKRFSLPLAFVGLLACLAPLWLFPTVSFPLTAHWLAPTLVATGLAVAWTLLITPSWVRTAADAYARALFGALERIPTATNQATASTA